MQHVWSFTECIQSFSVSTKFVACKCEQTSACFKGLKELAESRSSSQETKFNRWQTKKNNFLTFGRTSSWFIQLICWTREGKNLQDLHGIYHRKRSWRACYFISAFKLSAKTNKQNKSMKQTTQVRNVWQLKHNSINKLQSTGISLLELSIKVQETVNQL